MNSVSVAESPGLPHHLKAEPVLVSFIGTAGEATLIKEIIAQRTDIAGHEQVVLKVISLFYFI